MANEKFYKGDFYKSKNDYLVDSFIRFLNNRPLYSQKHYKLVSRKLLTCLIAFSLLYLVGFGCLSGYIFPRGRTRVLTIIPPKQVGGASTWCN